MNKSKIPESLRKKLSAAGRKGWKVKLNKAIEKLKVEGNKKG